MFCLSASYNVQLLFLTIHDWYLVIQSQRHLNYQHNAFTKRACCLELLVFLKAKELLTSNQFGTEGRRFSPSFATTISSTKILKKNMEQLSFVSIVCIVQRNIIFTNRKFVTIYMKTEFCKNLKFGLVAFGIPLL